MLKTMKWKRMKRMLPCENQIIVVDVEKTCAVMMMMS